MNTQPALPRPPRGRLRRRARALLLLAALLGAAASPADSASPRLPRNEDFTYTVHFLWFTNAAKAKLLIRRVGKARYRAELMAETTGFVGLLTQYRKNHYVSEMEYSPEKGRLLSRRYTKTVSLGSDITRSITVIDREKGEIRWTTTENGKVKDEGSEPIPEGIIYEDLLSAFFNLRIGAFGPLTRGRKLTITTLPAYQSTDEGVEDYKKEFVRNFDIRIADAATERAYRKRYEQNQENGLLALVKVPKELFGQKTGEIRVWLDAGLIPVAATVEDAILFGDVHGYLQKAVVQPAGKTPSR